MAVDFVAIHRKQYEAAAFRVVRSGPALRHRERRNAHLYLWTSTNMKKLLLCLTTLGFTGNSLAQACWSEWQRDGEWLLRTQCTQNISIPDTDRVCRSRVYSDAPRTAATCPAAAKVLISGSVSVEPADFQCTGLSPPAAGGIANVFYYGLGKRQGELQVVRDLCVQFGGRWEGVD